MANSLEKTDELIKNAIDMHIHTSPDIFPRLLSDIEAAKEAKEAGMKAILIKSHITTTADRAQIASEVVGFPVYGGLVLNLPVGGINSHAVEASLRMGAKQIWMPTFFSENNFRYLRHMPMFQKTITDEVKGIYLLNSDGTLRKDVREVLALLAEYNAILGTGHISRGEAMIVVEEARKLGIKKIIITHPLSPLVNYSIQDIKAVLEKGATIVEHNILDAMGEVNQHITISDIVDAVKAVGAGKTIMGTDGGQFNNPSPVLMMKDYIAKMLDSGISEQDIHTMVRDNPANLLEI